VVLFFIEAALSTGDRSFLKDARAGADQLLVTLAGEKESGLYTGVAGAGFALTEAFKATGDVKYKEGAVRCVRLVEERANRVGKGIEWKKRPISSPAARESDSFSLRRPRVEGADLRELRFKGRR
jgi:hypothetical protein